MSKIDWKGKAIERSQEIKRLNKRIKELTKSRDDWKEKSAGHKVRAENLEELLKKLKINLSKLAEIQ